MGFFQNFDMNYIVVVTFHHVSCVHWYHAVRAGVHFVVHSTLIAGGLSSTALALPGECLELSGHVGRRVDLAVDPSVRCDDVT